MRRGEVGVKSGLPMMVWLGMNTPVSNYDPTGIGRPRELKEEGDGRLLTPVVRQSTGIGGAQGRSRKSLTGVGGAGHKALIPWGRG